MDVKMIFMLLGGLGMFLYGLRIDVGRARECCGR